MSRVLVPASPLAVLGAGLFDAAEEPRPPRVPNFVESEFNPLVDLAVGRAVAGLDPDYQGAEYQGVTGSILISTYGDTTTADTASRRVAAGKRQSAMLFFQSIPNSILGHLGVTHGFTGPLTTLSARTMLLTQALAAAELALEDGCDRVVVIAVDLAAGVRVAATPGGADAAPIDRCAALVVQKVEQTDRPALVIEVAPAESASSPVEDGANSVGHGPVAALAALATQAALAQQGTQLPESPAYIEDCDPDGARVSYRVSRIGTPAPQERGQR